MSMHGTRKAQRSLLPCTLTVNFSSRDWGAKSKLLKGFMFPSRWEHCLQHGSHWDLPMPDRGLHQILLLSTWRKFDINLDDGFFTLFFKFSFMSMNTQWWFWQRGRACTQEPCTILFLSSAHQLIFCVYHSKSSFSQGFSNKARTPYSQFFTHKGENGTVKEN